MVIRNPLFRRLKPALLVALALNANATLADDKLEAAIASKDRTPKYQIRDEYRHPSEVLSFFGLQDDMKVVEIWPGGGWWTEILAPYLKDNGKLYAASYDPEHDVEYFRKALGRYKDKLAANAESYGDVNVTVLNAPEKTELAPPASVDMVLTFRNVHNWMKAGTEKETFIAMYKALKPGGILGIVEHRATTDAPQDPKSQNGYVRQDYTIKLANDAGFKLVASSEVNANPNDDTQHPRGVWTLPPSYALGEEDKELYTEIGESDRMTLKFIKPKS